nr:xylulose kinase-1 [Tanacetum cinerariifolium]
ISLSGSPHWDAQSLGTRIEGRPQPKGRLTIVYFVYTNFCAGMPPMLLLVPVFLLVVLVHADGWVSAGSSTIPTGSCTIPTGSYSFMLLDWFLLDDHNKVAYLEKGKGWEAYEQISDFLNRSHIRYALTHRPPIVFDSLVKQFWTSATVRTLEAGPSEIIATIDGNEVVVTESLIRTHLQLNDENGLYEFTLHDVLNGMREIGTYNFSRFILDGMIGNIGSKRHKFLMYLRFLQMILGLSAQRQRELDAAQLIYNEADWLELMAKIATNSALFKQLLGNDVNEDNMNERLGMILMRKRRELAERSRVKPINKTQQRDFMRDFMKNQSASIYNQGWTMKQVKALSITQLKHEFENIQRTLERSNLLNFKRTTFRPTPTLAAPSAKRARQGVPQDVHAASSQVPPGVSVAPSTDVVVLVFAAPSIPADVSVFAAPSVHADTEVDTDESRLDDPQTASEHISTEHTVDESTPSSSRTRRNDSDDDPFPYAPFAGWEMVPSPLGSIHAYYDMEEHTKHFTSLRELLHMVEKNDLRKLLGAVDNLYQREEPDIFALILWGDLRVLFQSLDDEDAHAFWHNQDSWRIRSWCLYPRAQVHVLETVEGRVIYMFVDVSYPLSAATLKRMLKHGLEVLKLLVGGDLTMAEQLVSFIKAALLNAQSAV